MRMTKLRINSTTESEYKRQTKVKIVSIFGECKMRLQPFRMDLLKNYLKKNTATVHCTDYTIYVQLYIPIANGKWITMHVACVPHTLRAPMRMNENCVQVFNSLIL